MTIHEQAAWGRANRIRYRFWMFVHDALEKVWHWVYYKHVVPNRKPDTLPGSTYFLSEGIWRENGDGTYTKISEGVDLGESNQ